MHGPVTRSAVGVLLIDLLIDRSRDVGSTCALVQDRRATVPVRLVACIAVNVAGGNPALAADSLDAKVHVHVVDALEGKRLGLEDEEVDYSCGDEVAAEEDKTESVTDTFVGIRCQKTARVRRGNVSPMTTQMKGPQVDAKDAMNMQAHTIMTMPEDVYSVGGRTMPMTAKMSNQAACQRPPKTRGMRRPKRSIIQRPGTVMATLTAPRINCVWIGSSIPADSKIVAP
jgi:hypothetical protein